MSPVIEYDAKIDVQEAADLAGSAVRALPREGVQRWADSARTSRTGQTIHCITKDSQNDGPKHGEPEKGEGERCHRSAQSRGSEVGFLESSSPILLEKNLCSQSEWAFPG